MKLVIGLGNPGVKYSNNRHNVGHLLIDRLPKIPHLKTFKTDTFMNNSGSFVKKLVDRFSISMDDLIIAHDDLDLLLGVWKIQLGKGPKDHRGLKSIEEALGEKNFMRVRIGVDARLQETRIPGEEYVLEDFTDKEGEILDKVIDEICKKLETL